MDFSTEKHYLLEFIFALLATIDVMDVILKRINPRICSINVGSD
jgi:hypothetical protein